MADSEGSNNPIAISTESIEHLHHFDHEAMHTMYEVWIVYEDSVYASQAAYAAFELLDKLEQELSRFIENSEVSQINALSLGERLRLSLSSYDCLSLSKDIYEQTDGAFDVTVGRLMDCFRNADGSPRTPDQNEMQEAIARTGLQHIHLTDDYFVTIDEAGVSVDLGGVGKGYAIDRMAELFEEWEIQRVLLSGGGSTIRAMEGPRENTGWPVSISNPRDRSRLLGLVHLQHQSLSCSGLEKGEHIIDPRTGKPVCGKAGAWVLTRNAVQADALTTGLMVMNREEIQQFSDSHPEIGIMMHYEDREPDDDNSAIIYYGNWPSDDSTFTR